MEESFHEVGNGVVQGWTASGAARSGHGGDETRVYRTGMKGAISQPLVGDLTFPEASAELETFPRTRGAARDRTKLGREGHWDTRLARGWKRPGGRGGVVLVWWLCDRLGLVSWPCLSNLFLTMPGPGCETSPIRIHSKRCLRVVAS